MAGLEGDGGEHGLLQTAAHDFVDIAFCVDDGQDVWHGQIGAVKDLVVATQAAAYFVAMFLWKRL
jgi:hypothetical protein